MTKERKTLEDLLGHQFVHGLLPENTQSQSEATPEPEPEATTPKLTVIPTSTKPVKSNLMDQLQQPSKEPTIRLTVDLPESMHSKLSVLAARTRRKKAEIVRMLIEQALKDVDE